MWSLYRNIARTTKAALIEVVDEHVSPMIDMKLDAKLEPVATKLSTIEAELSFNGGASVKDVVNKVARSVGVDADAR